MVEHDSPTPPASRRHPAAAEIAVVLVGSAFAIAIRFGLVRRCSPARSPDVRRRDTAASTISVFALSPAGVRTAVGSVVDRMGQAAGVRGKRAGGGRADHHAGLAFATAYWQLLALRLVAGVRLDDVHDLRGVAAGPAGAATACAGGRRATAGHRLPARSIGGPLLRRTWPRSTSARRSSSYARLLVLVIVVGGPMLRRPPGQPTTAGRRRGPVPGRRARARLPSVTDRETLNSWAVFGVRSPWCRWWWSRRWVATTFGGIALSVFAVGNAATLLLAGRLADRSGRRRR
ncbi:hypothetical protein HBB16_17880 [Pseudonocardia sp. MCCB 268]|nr:hypothetical protein [Pseudonocardia cytotoxica]